MTEEELIQKILDNDPKFKKLLEEAKETCITISKNGWPTEAEKIFIHKRTHGIFTDMPVEKFMAFYKCNTAFCILISKILKKLCVKDAMDMSKAITISPDKKAVLYPTHSLPEFYIYFKDLGWSVDVNLAVKKADPNTRLKEPYTHFGRIIFTLDDPAVGYNPINKNWDVSLPDSTIEIKVAVLSTILARSKVKVRDFKPEVLRQVIEDSKIGDN